MKITIESENIIKICNFCGKAHKITYSDWIGILEPISRFTINHTFGSKFFKENKQFTFDICDKCFEKLLKKCIIDPTIPDVIISQKK